jgi:hypothetical protein
MQKLNRWDCGATQARFSSFRRPGLSVSRRRFFQSATLSLLGGVALPSLFAKVAATSGGSLADEPFRPENLIAFGSLSQQTFLRLMGEDFAVSSDENSLGSITLISVTVDAPPVPAFQRIPLVGRIPRIPSQKIRSFSVRFQGPSPALPQGTYSLYNPALGSIPLLLVPSQPGTNPNTYSAVFGFLV